MKVGTLVSSASSLVSARFAVIKGQAGVSQLVQILGFAVGAGSFSPYDV